MGSQPMRKASWAKSSCHSDIAVRDLENAKQFCHSNIAGRDSEGAELRLGARRAEKERQRLERGRKKI